MYNKKDIKLVDVPIPTTREQFLKSEEHTSSLIEKMSKSKHRIKRITDKDKHINLKPKKQLDCTNWTWRNSLVYRLYWSPYWHIYTKAKLYKFGIPRENRNKIKYNFWKFVGFLIGNKYDYASNYRSWYFLSHLKQKWTPDFDKWKQEFPNSDDGEILSLIERTKKLESLTDNQIVLGDTGINEWSTDQEPIDAWELFGPQKPVEMTPEQQKAIESVKEALKNYNNR